MFTGLIQDVGQVTQLGRRAEGRVLTVATRLAAELRRGDSLAVNGVCLTVDALTGANQASLVVVPETSARSTLGRLRVGERVNLEPALRLGDRLGGHIVQGHVDAIGKVLSQGEDGGGGYLLRVSAPLAALRYVVEKGSVAVDGVSLTVAQVDEHSFSVALVPHTLSETVLGSRASGAEVNLEMDILARHVERLLATQLAAAGQPAPREPLSEASLREQGF